MDAQERGADCEERTFEDVETYTAKLIDVRMEDLRQKADLWWSHRIVVWQEQF